MNFSLGQARRVSADPPFFIKRAQGAHVWDCEGHRYLDLTSGWNVVNAGWNNPEIMEAWARCAEILPFKPSWCADEFSKALSDLLSDCWPGYMAIPGCSGAQGIDNALKVARLATGRSGVMSFAGAYHGSSTEPRLQRAMRWLIWKCSVWLANTSLFPLALQATTCVQLSRLCAVLGTQELLSSRQSLQMQDAVSPRRST